jgi:ElaB/YqjD/DUF883 family membrane-anchored ribosome-binding protein
MTQVTSAYREKLVADLRVVVADAEELLRLTAGQAGEQTKELRSRMKHRLDEAKIGLAHLQDTAAGKAQVVGHSADEYVHKNPWGAMGAAAVLGVVAGLLIGRY